MTAEFMGLKPRPSDPITAEGMSALGKTVPSYRRDAALKHMRQMCGDRYSTDQTMQCIDGMCEQIKRDEPYAAMQIAARYLDLTGMYRLLAVLLTAGKPRVQVKAGGTRNDR